MSGTRHEQAGASGKNRTGDKNQVQVIARAAAILRALEDAAPGLSLGQIAQRVNLARSTVQRIVGALETERLVIAASPTGRVRLGPTILRLAASVRTDFVSLARPFIVKLSNELRETVDLAIVKRDHLVFIDQVIGSQRLRTVSAVGETFPLHCTANGKAYLAEARGCRDRAADRPRLRGAHAEDPGAASIRCSTISNRCARPASPMTARNTLSAFAAAGVALRDLLGNYVAISVPVPAQRFSDHQRVIARKLLGTKQALQEYLTASG